VAILRWLSIALQSCRGENRHRSIAAMIQFIFVFYNYAAWCQSRYLNGPYLGFVATHGQYPGFGPKNFPGVLQAQSRTYHSARDDLVQARLIYVNYYGSEEANPGAERTISIAIEWPNGVFHRVTCGGATLCVIPDGGQIVSDPLGPWAPARNQNFHVWTWQSSASGILANATSRQVDGLNMGAVTSDLTTTGGVVQPNDFAYGPTAIIGVTSQPSFFIGGDSRTESSYDFPGSNDSGNVAVWIGPKFAYINVAVHGEDLWRQLTSSNKRRAFAQYATHVIYASGINTLTSDTAGAALRLLVKLAAQFPGKPFYDATIEPFTLGTAPISSLTLSNDSATAVVASTQGMKIGQLVTLSERSQPSDSGIFRITALSPTSFSFECSRHPLCRTSADLQFGDDWASAAGQSLDPVPRLAEKIRAFNAGVRAGLPGVAGFFDLSAVAANPNSPDRWNGPGFTTDGLHGTALFAQTLAKSLVIPFGASP
jgi:hypothetical protein